MDEAQVCLQLFRAWLEESQGLHCVPGALSALGHASLSARLRCGRWTVAVEVRPLLGPPPLPWQERREALEGRLAERLEGAYALWLPPGADLPSPGPETEEFLVRVQEAAGRLAPGQRSSLALPAVLYLRKTRQEGAVITVSGPLDAYWARLSERASGTYELDSTRLHRLPEDEEEREALFQAIWEAARRIQEPGQWAEVEVADLWTLQRLMEGQGFVIVGTAPASAEETGLAVRRNLRHLLAEASPRLLASEADARALVLLGYYAHMEQEGVSVALRGYDPSLYSGLDLVCLAADGRLRPVLQSPALPWR